MLWHVSTGARRLQIRIEFYFFVKVYKVGLYTTVIVESGLGTQPTSRNKHCSRLLVSFCHRVVLSRTRFRLRRSPFARRLLPVHYHLATCGEIAWGFIRAWTNSRFVFNYFSYCAVLVLNNHLGGLLLHIGVLYERSVVPIWDAGCGNPDCIARIAAVTWVHTFLWCFSYKYRTSFDMLLQMIVVGSWSNVRIWRFFITLLWLIQTNIRLRSLVYMAIVIDQVSSIISDALRCHHSRKVRSPLMITPRT